MKILFVLTLFTIQAFAVTPRDLSKELSKDIQQDIQKDDDKFRKTSSRAPASVDSLDERKIEDTPKIDKSVRQIGPNKW